MGLFKEGNSYGKGRPKGAVNRLSHEAREALSLALSGEIQKISTLLEEISDPKDRIDAISKLLPYIMPKLSNVDMQVDDITEDKLKYFDFTQLAQDDLNKIFKIIYEQHHRTNEDDKER